MWWWRGGRQGLCREKAAAVVKMQREMGTQQGHAELQPSSKGWQEKPNTHPIKFTEQKRSLVPDIQEKNPTRLCFRGATASPPPLQSSGVSGGSKDGSRH
ncbi:hypothetical protein DR999_PMT18362 [Platysternon megacephalum]|uniref:Uncharacterized protein n=1 Tax=Platysternon megacephalum TaxID=55544 RepID=A0A4D9DX16_9SAUR|nr:hypothetical protein DR999_PMT18362 [Platysternon megacephalum]